MFNILILLAIPIIIVIIIAKISSSFKPKDAKSYNTNYINYDYKKEKSTDKSCSPEYLDKFLEKTIKLIDENKKLEAIKLLKENTSMSLKDAKDIVDKISK